MIVTGGNKSFVLAMLKSEVYQRSLSGGVKGAAEHIGVEMCGGV